MKMMDKRIMVSMPAELYSNLVKIAEKEYVSISAYIRKAVMERMEEEFSPEEITLIEKGRKDFRKGKGVSWRKIKREHS